MKYLKMLGLAAVAAAALMALVGPASASATVEFHSSAEPTTLVGIQEGTHKFTVEGSAVTCTKAEFTGTATKKTQKIQNVHPVYTGCTAFGFAGATVDTEGCEYEFDATKTTTNLKNCTKGYVTINVTSIFNTRCHVTVPDSTTNGKNSAVNGISWENMAPKTTFTNIAAANNIHFTVDVSTGLCPLTQGKTGTTGQYAGITALKGNGGTAELWIE